MNWVDAEYGLVALAAMLSPLTLTWSVLALVLSRQPLRTGLWFYFGALVATLAIGVAAVFLLGNAAASHSSSTPKTWVAVLDVVLAVLLLVWVVRLLRRPLDPEKQAAMTERMRGVAPLAAAIVLLVVARDWTDRLLGIARVWLERHMRTIGAVIVIVLAASLLRSGIAGLT